MSNVNILEMPEFKTFVSDIRPLFGSFDLLKKADTNLGVRLARKEANWVDYALFGFAVLNVGAQAIKTYSDGRTLVNALAKPQPTPISVNWYLTTGNPALMLLNNQRLNVFNGKN